MSNVLYAYACVCLSLKKKKKKYSERNIFIIFSSMGNLQMYLFGLEPMT